jgi:hypothetical protein
MEWRSKEKKNIKYPKHNDSRVRRTFLLFPKTLKGITKWLCFVKIEQHYLKTESKPTGGFDWQGHPGYSGCSQFWFDYKWFN